MPTAEWMLRLGAQALSLILGVSGLFFFYTSFYDPTVSSAANSIILLGVAVALVWATEHKPTR